MPRAAGHTTRADQRTLSEVGTHEDTMDDLGYDGGRPSSA